MYKDNFMVNSTHTQNKITRTDFWLSLDFITRTLMWYKSQCGFIIYSNARIIPVAFPYSSSDPLPVLLQLNKLFDIQIVCHTPIQH
jgi:hypothetical protein